MSARPALDLDAYLGRIGYAGDRSPTLEVLEAVHLAHATHIPFENLDILLGCPIRLDLDSLQAKLVRGQRGGYCFEQNLLFAAVLERLGFAVTRLAARVRYGATQLLPRTHMLLTVDVDGATWLADVGFGGEGLLRPLPLIHGRVTPHYAWSYRVVEDSGLWVLQSLGGGQWHDFYAFTREPHYLVDFEVANYYVSTHPNSIFVRSLTAQRPTPTARYVLRKFEFTVSAGETAATRTLAGDEDLLHVLAEHFGLRFPVGTRFAFERDTATK